MDEQVTGALTDEQRAAYRSFVRTHHPDRGGDPAVFVAGLQHYRELARTGRKADGPAAPDRYDAPIHIVRDLPLPTRVAVALIRTIRRKRRTRVDRPT
ncbi:hypothetical protein [Pseudonocardia endophytica]|uniref:J domain-containing protein n=1 Tax=Pseudonocardia endophytica TaxID=401976 RepID=A0A4R1HXV8_PSEEN|nr:hypothetical protein [Pseudonocardia endophytica]TCK24909.1 hypothetical protein EV378_0704 [Pseudonocardia endophytica]